MFKCGEIDCKSCYKGFYYVKNPNFKHIKRFITEIVQIFWFFEPLHSPLQYLSPKKGCLLEKLK